MDRAQLSSAIYRVSHLKGEFLLRSGQVSDHYFDKYRFESHPELLRAVGREMAKILPPNIDYLAGLEMGGIPIAVALSFETGIPTVFIRKKAKEYGTCQFAEGAEIREKRLCIVEDVITTGGQVVLSAQDLRKSGAIVDSVVCAIYRGEGKEKRLTDIELDHRSLFTMKDLLPGQS